MIITREGAAKVVAELGIVFVPHSKSWSGWLGWWAERFDRWRGWRDRFWMTIGRKVHHPDDINPLDFPTTVLHEATHTRRQLAVGVAWWVFRYTTSWRYRYQEEREAYLVDLLAGEVPVSWVTKTLREVYGVKLSEDEMSKWFRERMFACGA